MPFDGSEYEQPRNPLFKIEQVIDLLTTENRWCKNRLETDDGRRCIVGAMKAVDAAYVLYKPILGAIKDVTGQTYCRIETFNDDPHTTHERVLQVLYQARENLQTGTPNSWAPSWKMVILDWCGLGQPM